MKRFALFVLLLVATGCMADQITFSFVYSSTSTPSVVVASTGVTLGPAQNLSITDNTTGVTIPLTAVDTASTGTASSFLVSPNLLLASFNAGGADSLLITQGSTVLLSGVLNDHASVVSTFPAGAGAFLASFTVTHVDASILADFGLAPVFSPIGSVTSTYAGANLVNPKELTASGGGGAVTFTAPREAVIPEPPSLALAGFGMLTLAVLYRRK